MIPQTEKKSDKSLWGTFLTDGAPKSRPFLFSKHLPGRFHNIVRAQPVHFQDFPSRAGLSEFVLYADAAYPAGVFLAEQFADCAAQPADNAVFLGGEDQAGLFRCFEYDVAVQGLNGRSRARERRRRGARRPL